MRLVDPRVVDPGTHNSNLGEFSGRRIDSTNPPNLSYEWIAPA